jgi:hypothetical protein
MQFCSWPTMRDFAVGSKLGNTHHFLSVVPGTDPRPLSAGQGHGLHAAGSPRRRTVAHGRAQTRSVAMLGLDAAMSEIDASGVR